MSAASHGEPDLPLQEGDHHLPIGARIIKALHRHPDDGGPLYLRLAQAIRSLIETGELRGGEALPSERDLAKGAGYSRITVRSAIKDLLSQGLLYKRRGAGTFVSRQIDQPLSVLLGFTADMKRRGAQTGSLVLQETINLPSPEEVLKLGLSPRDQVFRLSRVRISDGDPLAIEHAVVPASALPPEGVSGSLYEALKRSNHMPVRALQRLHAAIAGPDEAQKLGIKPGAAILHIERLSFLANGRPIEVTNSAYRGDRYDFIAELAIEEQEE